MLQKLIGYCYTPEDVDDLRTWIEGTNEDLKHLTAELGDKWSIVYKMHGVGNQKYTDEQLKEVFDKLYDEDQTDVKKGYKLKIEALRANDEARAALFEQYFNPETKLSYKEIESSVTGFTSSRIPAEIRKGYAEKFFEKITDAMRNRTKEVAKTIYYGLLPLTDDENYKLEKLMPLIEDIKEGEIFLKKSYNQSHEELLRIQKARAFDDRA